MEVRSLSPLALLLIVAGCVGAPPEPVESEAAQDKATDREVHPTITQTLPWPGGSSASGTMAVTTDDGSRLEISAPRHVIAQPTKFTVEVGQSVGQWFSTTMAFMVYHRSRNGGALEDDSTWQPLECLRGYWWDRTKNNLYLFDTVTIDPVGQSIKSGLAGYGFDICQVWEPDPVFAIVPVPLYNAWNMYGQYGYDLEVLCQDSSGSSVDCAAY